MEYKHIKNITELFIKEYSECYDYQKDFVVLPKEISWDPTVHRLCNHSKHTLTKEPFCLNVESEAICPHYQLLWLTPDGTPLFSKTKPGINIPTKLVDHLDSIFYVLKKYYRTLNTNDRKALLKHFFGLISHNPRLIDAFEKEHTPGEKIPSDLHGNFDSDEYEHRLKGDHTTPLKHYTYTPRFNNYMYRFMYLTGIVRLRLKTILTGKQIQEQTGFNIEIFQKLTLNQQQFLREFIEVNKLIDKKSLFIDDHTPYKSVRLNLGVVVEEKFHDFGHAYRVLTKIQ